MQITLNLIESYHGVLTLLVVWTIALNPMSKIALTLNPVALALEEIFFPEEATSSHSHIGTFSTVYRVLLRTALGVGALCCALYVPHFARVTSFVGAFFAMLASVFLPCICYLKLFYHQLSQKEKCANILLATLSILFAIIGTLSSFISPAD
jgi:vesicular inhibitory amino acid transporter